MTMPKPNDSAARTRRSAKDRLLDAAAELFAAHGVNSVGIDSVIERAGVAKMTLYNHFPSKDDLVAATLERVDQQWFDWLRAAVDRLAKKPEDRLDAFFDALAEWFDSPGFRGCPFLNAQAELADASHPARVACEDHADKLRSFLDQTLRHSGVAVTPTLVDDVLLITEGAVTLAAVQGTSDPARRAKRLARTLVAR